MEAYEYKITIYVKSPAWPEEIEAIITEAIEDDPSLELQGIDVD